MQLTPFLKPPNLEVKVENDQSDLIARVDIIETNTSKLVFTVHLRIREGEPPRQYTLVSRLYYPDLEGSDTHRLFFQA